MAYYTDDYQAKWKVLRPHLPLPILHGVNTARSIEMFIEPELWATRLRSNETLLWDMSQASLCGFFVPPFQRPRVWDKARKIAFIESAYLGLPLGTIVYNDVLDQPMANGKFHHTDHWLIDGQQRCDALTAYVKDEFPIFEGTEHRHCWSDLSKRERSTFGQIQISIIKLNVADEADLRIIYDRINFGGVPHNEEQRATFSPAS